MTENKNDKPKREVPIFTYKEYKKIIEERRPFPRTYKISKEDEDIFLRSITK